MTVSAAPSGARGERLPLLHLRPARRVAPIARRGAFACRRVVGTGGVLRAELRSPTPDSAPMPRGRGATGAVTPRNACPSALAGRDIHTDGRTQQDEGFDGPAPPSRGPIEARQEADPAATPAMTSSRRWGEPVIRTSPRLRRGHAPTGVRRSWTPYQRRRLGLFYHARRAEEIIMRALFRGEAPIRFYHSDSVCTIISLTARRPA